MAIATSRPSSSAAPVSARWWSVRGLGDESCPVQLLLQILGGESAGGGTVDVDASRVSDLGHAAFELVEIDLAGGAFDRGGLREGDLAHGRRDVVVAADIARRNLEPLLVGGAAAELGRERQSHVRVTPEADAAG